MKTMTKILGYVNPRIGAFDKIMCIHCVVLRRNNRESTGDPKHVYQVDKGGEDGSILPIQDES